MRDVRRYCVLMAVALATCVLLAGVAGARVWYVDDTGSSSNGGTSSTDALKSIMDGVNRAQQGDMVYVLPGDYSENLVLKSGVNVIGSGPEWTVVEGYRPEENAPSAFGSGGYCNQCHSPHTPAGSIWNIATDPWPFDPITMPGGTVKAENVTNAVFAGFTIGLQGRKNGSNDYYHGWNRGVMVGGTTDATFVLRNNVIYTPPGGRTSTGNLIYPPEKAGVGIMVVAPATPTVLNNTFASTYDGAFAGKVGLYAPAGEFRNNIVYGYNDAILYNSATLVHQYNFYSENRYNSATLGIGELSVDGVGIFFSPDFQLSDLSSDIGAVDGGDPNPLFNDSDNTRNDMGAFGGNYLTDSDTDSIPDFVDNCPAVFNPDQQDFDGDYHGDVCDNCMAEHNLNQYDSDNDGIGDVCDSCPMTAICLSTESQPAGVPTVFPDGWVEVCVQWPATNDNNDKTYIVPPDCANVQFELVDANNIPLEPDCLTHEAYNIEDTLLLNSTTSTESCVTCDLKERFSQLSPSSPMAGVSITGVAYESYITNLWFDPASGSCVNPTTGLPDVNPDTTHPDTSCRKLWVGRVVMPPVLVHYDWNGFFSPIDNNRVNKIKPGSAVPIKFSLGGNMGLDIFADGFPTSVLITDTGPDSSTNVVTETAGGSGLSYDPATGQYSYIWKTQKSWDRTSRQLQIKLKGDITENVHTADFTFTK